MLRLIAVFNDTLDLRHLNFSLGGGNIIDTEACAGAKPFYEPQPAAAAAAAAAVT